MYHYVQTGEEVFALLPLIWFILMCLVVHTKELYAFKIKEKTNALYLRELHSWWGDREIFKGFFLLVPYFSFSSPLPKSFRWLLLCGTATRCH